MANDVVSIRMMIAAKPSEERDCWRRGAAFASVRVEVSQAVSAAEAARHLETAGIDIVVIDAGFGEPDRSAIAQKARAARTRPLVVYSTESDADAIGADGDGVVTRPGTVAEAQFLVDRILHARLPNKVLVVDDSGTTRSIVKKILMATRFPLEVSEAAEGAAALARLRNGKYDIIFLDYNMPGLNGLATLAEIKRNHPALEVVMITATQDEAMASRARAAGAAAFLKKPFFPADIDQVLHAYCGIRQIPTRA
jgi:CheY-like chemotaxis protein